MENIYSRTQMLIGSVGTDKLKESSILLFGVGGVGGQCFEALVRSGIGHIGIVDNAVITESNLNRQVLALRSNIGKKKVDVAFDRAMDINPNCVVDKYDMFVSKDNIEEIQFNEYDYVIDCIDTVTSKILIIEQAKKYNINIISSMGTGNKLDSNFCVADISKTSVCPLARSIRKILREKGIKGVKVLYSKDQPLEAAEVLDVNGRHIPGSISYVPPIAGLRIAEEVIKDLIDSTISLY